MVKTIAISDEVYQKLIIMKREDESFSELFDRLAKCPNSHQVLTKLRLSVVLEKEQKDKILTEISKKRSERRR